MAETMTEPRSVNSKPLSVELTKEDLANPRFSPRELRVLRERTGMSLGQLLADEGNDEKFTALAWLKLRRSGQPLEWDDMDDVVIELKLTESALDPTSAPSSSPSSTSAGSGG